MTITERISVLKLFSGSSPSEEEQNELYSEVLLKILARGSNSDSNIHPLEIETIQQIMQRETGHLLTEPDIRMAARSHLNESAKLRKYFRSARRQLNLEDRIKIAQSLADVIKSDAQINVLEIDFFNRAVDALGIPRAEQFGLPT